jgi:hypothetical protein
MLARFEYSPCRSVFAPPLKLPQTAVAAPHPLPCRICRKLEADIQAGKNHHRSRKEYSDLDPGTCLAEYRMYAARLPVGQPIQGRAAGAEHSPDQVRAGLHRSFQKQGMPQHGRRLSREVSHGRSVTGPGRMQDITASPSDLSMPSITELSGQTASNLSSLLHRPAPGPFSKETMGLEDMPYKPRGGAGCSLADLLKAKYNRVSHHQ